MAGRPHCINEVAYEEFGVVEGEIQVGEVVPAVDGCNEGRDDVSHQSLDYGCESCANHNGNGEVHLCSGRILR